MLLGKRLVVVLPAYNAAKTLTRTINEVPTGIVDEFVLVDDASSDETAEVARALGVTCVRHPENRGYGGNQKTCYKLALEKDAEVVVMLHPDYQYSPRLVPALAWLVASDEYDIALGSRILGGGAIRGGMPVYKYIANRFLTFAQNVATGAKLSEYHTGFRAFSRRALQTIPWEENSNDFVFDNQILNQALGAGLRIGEISCPAKYFEEASSINFRRSVTYGFGVVGGALAYRLKKKPKGRLPA